MKRAQLRLVDAAQITRPPQEANPPTNHEEELAEAKSLPILEISRAWSKVTKDSADLLVQGFFAAYWRGHFETHGVSAVFQLCKPDGPYVSSWNAKEGEGTYEITQVGKRQLTAKRERVYWSRRDLFRDRLVGADGSEDEMRALATRQVSKYPSDFLTIWLPELRIERADFARWYSNCSLSAGAPLESFWPGPVHVKRRKANSGRKPKYTPAQLAALRSETFRLLDEYGDPVSNNPHTELKSKEDLIKALQKWAVTEKSKDFREEPARATIQDDVNEWLKEWRTQQTAGN